MRFESDNLGRLDSDVRCPGGYGKPPFSFQLAAQDMRLKFEWPWYACFASIRHGPTFILVRVVVIGDSTALVVACGGVGSIGSRDRLHLWSFSLAAQLFLHTRVTFPQQNGYLESRRRFRVDGW
jgi:hypothetical protein